VELKNGVTFNGHLVECDNFMNVTLREVYQTSADGEKFWKMREMFIKGNIVGPPLYLHSFPLILFGGPLADGS
jgi:small nuclear ribonucleoprotein (snRNP)-like protein